MTDRTQRYVYFWNRPEGMSRKGQTCIVTARGKLNAIRVEFQDGFTMITHRHSVRKAKDTPND